LLHAEKGLPSQMTAGFFPAKPASVIPGRCAASNYDEQLHIGESRDSGFALTRASE
jgi:hypothetical protein